ncbi:MAG TPA: ATP-binding cassette domain-containing protein [Planctomycetota bacterium]|nr:ATP-binding cassette domain-containing protein [Planctomycetota bacterium]
MTSAPAVSVEKLSRAYGERVALRDLSLDVGEREVFGVLGPNGGGKTTLFRILATLILPSSGTARIFGNDVVADPDGARLRFGVVFQSASLDRNLTVEENLRHQGHLYGLRGADLHSRIEEALSRFGLGDRRRERVRKLSGGLARRVELAKGLLHRPALLLLDEPSVGLDPAARAELWSHLRDLRAKEGTTILFTTHFLDEAEGCDRLAILDRGSLVALGAPESLKGEVGGDVVTVEGGEPERLRERIARECGVEGTVVDGKVRIEHREGHALAKRLADALGPALAGVTVRRPTLEDVFVRRTSRRFEDGA